MHPDSLGCKDGESTKAPPIINGGDDGNRTRGDGCKGHGDAKQEFWCAKRLNQDPLKAVKQWLRNEYFNCGVYKNRTKQYN